MEMSRKLRMLCEYASMTSVDVQKSYSNLKHLHSDKKKDFKIKHLVKLSVIYVNR